MNDGRNINELCRTDFATFAIRAFYELYPDGEIIWNWHLDVIVAELMAMARGEKRRQLVLVPPRSLKSFLCSVAWPAYLLGHEPGLKIIAVSYAQSLADDLARLCHDLMTSDWYKSLFKTRLVRGRQPIDNIRTTRRGHRIATSIGGTLTGRGADIVIIDDPLKAEDAMSEAMRTAVKSWFSNTLPSRTDDKATGRVLVVMQRLHPDDPASYLAEAGWPALTLPAIAPEDRTFVYPTALGLQKKEWLEGEPLQAEREPLHVLAETRAEMGSYSFGAQYLLDPEPVDGHVIKRAWLRSYPPLEKPNFTTILQSWDTASKTAEFNDYSVCTTWGITSDNRYYLLDVFRQRLEHPDLVRAVVGQKERHGAQIVLIEDKVSGTSIVQELTSRGMTGIIPVVPKGDKAMRLVAVSPQFESGRVMLPECAPWRDDYDRELTTFPGKNDDQVDSTTQALIWLSENFVEPSILVYARREMAERERRRTATVRLRAPGGVAQTVILSNGEMLNTDNDGCVDILETEAAPYLRIGWKRL